jgi:uncharacterized protein
MTEKAQDSADEAPKARPCPICGKPATSDMRPFCSKRCADVDLHRWLGGTYAVPVVEDGTQEPNDSEEES